jgi:hypothetical protein
MFLITSVAALQVYFELSYCSLKIKKQFFRSFTALETSRKLLDNYFTALNGGFSARIGLES